MGGGCFEITVMGSVNSVVTYEVFRTFRAELLSYLKEVMESSGLETICKPHTIVECGNYPHNTPTTAQSIVKFIYR